MSSTPLSTHRSTPLHDLHASLGATFTAFAGWDMPVRYTSELEEHRAVRTAAGIFDLSHMGQIQLRGPHAGAVLDAALVGWLSHLTVGKAKYTMMCNDSGGVVDDLVVYRTDEEQFLMVANASNHSTVLAQLLVHSAAYDAEVTDRSQTDALIAIQGPAAVEILRDTTDTAIDDLSYYAIRRGEIKRVPVQIARTGYTGEDGFEIYVDQRDAARIWTTLSESGSTRDLRPAGLACRDTLRLEAGMPLYGHELAEDLTPFDAGMGRLVSFDKPTGFTGREALEIRAAQATERILVGLEIEGRRIARAGHTVLAEGSGLCVGRVTSGAPSPTLDRPIAMAYVDRQCAETGTELAVDIRGRREACRVVDLPFYRRPR